MKKERTKGWLGLFGTLLILFYIGSVYRIGGFSAGFALVLLSGILAVPAVLLASYRRVGSLPAWATVAAAFPVLYLAAGDTATAALAWALLSGIFGLAFGALCAPVDLLLGDIGYVISKWISGIPFDVMHCAGNFIMALVLFVPMRKLVEKLYRKIA